MSKPFIILYLLLALFQLSTYIPFTLHLASMPAKHYQRKWEREWDFLEYDGTKDRVWCRSCSMVRESNFKHVARMELEEWCILMPGQNRGSTPEGCDRFHKYKLQEDFEFLG